MPASRPVPTAEGVDARQEVHTLIFVDVDGVLNIGARDDAGGAPLLFSNVNVEQATKLVGNGGVQAAHECVQKLLAINEHKTGPNKDEALSTLASSGPAGVSPVLAQRLVQLIHAAGPNCTTVLSSSWRRPQHKSRAARLEQEMTRHMGKSFSFDERTPLRDDSSASERLKCIGDYLRARGTSLGGKVQILVLEDFFITPLTGWSCGGVKIDGAKAAEKYLLSCLPESVTATAKVVHTYGKWVTSNGITVEVGTGITMEHFNQALDFICCPCGCPNEITYLSLSKGEDQMNKSSSTGCYQGAIRTGRSAKSLILADPQAQRRWLECLSLSVPWISITSMWSI